MAFNKMSNENNIFLNHRPPPAINLPSAGGGPFYFSLRMQDKPIIVKYFAATIMLAKRILSSQADTFKILN